jgi:putative hydrolase of the HAD superfamily
MPERIEQAGLQMLISDFGGVLTTPLIQSFAAVQDGAGIPPDSLVSALASLTESEGTNPLFELECGRIPESEFMALMSRQLSEDLGREIEFHDLGDRFFEALHPNEGMIDLIREVRRNGYRTALLTNNVREWEPQWRSMLPVDELFETVVDSAFVGCRKPDPRIYELTLDRVGLPPEACIFVDDTEVNCEAAEELGIRSVHFRETAQARVEIHSLLGLAAGGSQPD